MIFPRFSIHISLEQYENIIQRCSDFSNGLNEVEPLFLQWILRSQSASSDICDLIDMEEDPKNNFPETWHSLTAITRAISYVMTGDKQIRKFLAHYHETLSDDAVKILKRLRDTPMKRIAFTVEKTIAADLHSIVDVFHDEQMPPLYSKYLTDFLKDRTEEDPLHCNGMCLQAFSFFHRFYCVIPDDLEFLGSSLAGNQNSGQTEPGDVADYVTFLFEGAFS